MALDTTVGGESANSYITVSEADDIISASGLSTTHWQDLSVDQGLRVTGTVTGPFRPITGVSDLMLFAVGEDGSDQLVTFPSGDVDVSATDSCVLLNAQITGLTFSPTSDSKISIWASTPTDTIYIKAVDTSSYNIFGFSVGTYLDATTTSKEYLLQLAAQLIGFLPLRGRRYNGGSTLVYQALDFPRTCQSDPTIVPDAVKQAQALIACLVVLPNFLKQVELSDNILLPAAIQNAVVNQVKVAGIMDVKTSESTSSGTGTEGSTNYLESIGNVFALPIYLRMKPYISQIRGGALTPVVRQSPDYLETLLNNYGYEM